MNHHVLLYYTLICTELHRLQCCYVGDALQVICSRQWQKSAVVADSAVCSLHAAALCCNTLSSRSQYNPLLQPHVVPVDHPHSPPAPFLERLWEARNEIGNPEGPSVSPEWRPPQHTFGAQLFQKREIIRESSRRSRSSAGWRRKKEQLQHSGSLFKNSLICFRQPTIDLMEDITANYVFCAWWQFNTFYSLNPTAKLFLWSCLTLAVYTVQRVVLPFHSFSPFSEQV